MYERIIFSLRSPDKRGSPEFRNLIALWEMRNYTLSSTGPFWNVGAPLVESDWRAEVSEALRTGVAVDFTEEFFVQQFTAAETAAAPLFRMVHMGRDIDFPIGKDRFASPSHITTIDTSAACPTCGAGAIQRDPLRLKASELEPAGPFVSITLVANDFYIVRGDFAQAWSTLIGENLPLLAVEATGKAARDTEWFQLVPAAVLPADSIRDHRAARTPCAICGILRMDWGDTLPHGPYHTALPALAEAKLPPIVWSHWIEGELTRFPDGRVRQYPGRSLWLRGDVARALATFKVRGLDLIPIIWDNPTTVP